MSSKTDLKPVSQSEAQLLRDVCRAIGYTEKRLREESGLLVPPPDNVSPEIIANIVHGSSPFHVFARMFFLGRSVEASVVSESIPASLIEIAVQSGMLTRDGTQMRPNVLLVPIGNTLFASDLQRIDDLGNDDYVSTLCDAALHLALAAVPTPVERTLDLCSGFAMHSVLASSFSEHVIASDLNPRAEPFARFNASLNECDNIEPVTGNLFEAVSDKTFDLILTNPPFVITPDTLTTYRSNPIELDGFVKQLITDAPRHLNEGGLLQSICEWVEIENQDWTERLSTWFENSGCDVWVLTANRQLPSSYAMSAVRRLIDDPVELTDEVERWETHFAERGVVAIHGGFVFMRKREGKNWFDVTQLTGPLQRPIGKEIEQGFRNRDLLFDHDTPDALLDASLVVSEGLRQVETSHWDDFRWKRDTITLHVDQGLPTTIGIDEYVRTLIETFDRNRPVRESLDVFAKNVGLAIETATEQGVGLIRSMLKAGVLNVRSN